MHWLPPELLSDDDLMEQYLHIVPRAYDTIAYLKKIPGAGIKQIMIEKPKGYVNLNMGPESIDPEDRVAVMNEGKIDKAILRVPCFQEWLNLDMCKQVNDGMAAYAKRHPGRFYTLGVVPPWGDKASLREIERCMKELGCVGMQVAAHYGHLYLDCVEFRPFWKKISEMDVPVCVHHTPLPVQYEMILNNDTFRRQFGRCQDQAIAVGREIFSDLFEEFQNLKLVHSMMGGGFFAFSNVLAPETSKVKEEMERFDLSAAAKARKHLYQNIYFGISAPMSWGAPQLECAVKVFGADRLFFGCSYPVRKEWLTSGVDFINGLNISNEEKKLILGVNAQKMFHIS
jgi:predicted TIM-barrel fold metal-dependent hydrolase